MLDCARSVAILPPRFLPWMNQVSAPAPSSTLTWFLNQEDALAHAPDAGCRSSGWDVAAESFATPWICIGETRGLNNIERTLSSAAEVPDFILIRDFFGRCPYINLFHGERSTRSDPNSQRLHQSSSNNS